MIEVIEESHFNSKIAIINIFFASFPSHLTTQKHYFVTISVTCRKRLHDDVLHISKKPLRGELSGFLSIYQAEASCISPKVY